MKSKKVETLKALLKLREHRETLAGRRLKDAKEDRLFKGAQLEAQKAKVSRLEKEMHGRLELNLSDSKIVDPFARFSSFAFSLNAARETLLFEEAKIDEAETRFHDSADDVLASERDLKARRRDVERMREATNRGQEELRRKHRRHMDRDA